MNSAEGVIQLFSTAPDARGAQLETVALAIHSSNPFTGYLELFQQQFGQHVTWFEYEDDDRDRITVSSDQDVSNMLQMYAWMQTQQASPLVVHPRTGSPEGGAAGMNVLGLTIDVGREPEPAPELPPIETSSAEIKDEDLQPVEALGSGNGGTVYRTLHIPTNNIIAVKIIPVDLAEDVQRKILMELEILHKCRSDFIIQYYGAFFSENRIKICTEYMDGGSLDQYGQIPESILGPMVSCVLQGLHYLSTLKIMHRDVKPSNILVNSLGQVKLCDFGVGTQLQQSVTQTFVGTNAYMAPERILAQPYTVRSEVWSLAVSLVEMAIGHFPYPSTNEDHAERTLLPIELLQCIVNEPPPDLPEGHFSGEFRDFVARCLLKDASLRPTPGELLSHEFVQIHASRGGVIREWVCSILEQRQLAAQQGSFQPDQHMLMEQQQHQMQHQQFQPEALNVHSEMQGQYFEESSGSQHLPEQHSWPGYNG